MNGTGAPRGAGDLDERVVFERPTRVPDGAGGGPRVWTPLHDGTVAAKVAVLSGRERLMGDQIEAPRSHRIWVRRSPLSVGLTAADRVVWRGQPMNIRFVGDGGPRAAFVALDAESGVAT